jgi:hypothetical protein
LGGERWVSLLLDSRVSDGDMYLPWVLFVTTVVDLARYQGSVTPLVFWHSNEGILYFYGVAAFDRGFTKELAPSLTAGKPIEDT